MFQQLNILKCAFSFSYSFSNCHYEYALWPPMWVSWNW